MFDWMIASLKRVFADHVIAMACIRATDHLCSIIIMICPTILYYAYREIMWENTIRLYKQ